MVFKLNATLGNVRLSGGEWKITFCVPATDAVEMAKVCLACQEELLKLEIGTETSEPIGQAQ